MKGLFLDRDGVINVDSGYVHRKKEFKFIDGIFHIVREAKVRNYKIIVITNQSGIGRQYYTEREFLLLTRWMKKRFEKESAPIDKVYYSPYHPTSGIGKYKRDHETRKPNPGLINRAKSRLGLDLEDSLLIGDNLTDIQAGIQAGIGKNLLFQKSPNCLKNINSVIKISNLHEAIAHMKY